MKLQKLSDITLKCPRCGYSSGIYDMEVDASLDMIVCPNCERSSSLEDVDVVSSAQTME